MRWIVPLAQQGLTVRLEVEASLVALLNQGLAWLPRPPEVVAKATQPAPELVQLPCQGSLMSLPSRFGGAPLPEAFRGSIGYLDHPTWQISPPTWPHPPIPDRARPWVGVVWASGRKMDDLFTAREYHRRSLPAPGLAELLHELDQLGAQLVRLQQGDDRDAGHDSPWSHRLPQDADFAETARWIRQLDLVITVDTAAAHLVGALAHPGWLLLPWASDPRWLRHRQDSPWYPSLTLLRQPAPGDWRGLVELVLEQFCRWQWRRSAER